MDSGRYDVKTLLADLSGHVDWPAPSDLVPGVGRRLALPPPRRRPQHWTAATAVLVVVVVALLLISPQARRVVADLLGVAGIEVSFDPELETPTGAGLGLGRTVGLQDGIDSVEFAVSAPDRLGSPDVVFLSGLPTSGRLDMVWEGGATLPAAGRHNVGVLYSQFQGSLDGEGFNKSLGRDTEVAVVEIGVVPGFWIEGAPHVISYEDASGTRHAETTRLSGNVMMWESGGVTHRIETSLSLEETLSIAESVEPVG